MENEKYLQYEKIEDIRKRYIEPMNELLLKEEEKAIEILKKGITRKYLRKNINSVNELSTCLVLVFHSYIKKRYIPMKLEIRLKHIVYELIGGKVDEYNELMEHHPDIMYSFIKDATCGKSLDDTAIYELYKCYLEDSGCVNDDDSYPSLHNMNIDIDGLSKFSNFKTLYKKAEDIIKRQKELSNETKKTEFYKKLKERKANIILDQFHKWRLNMIDRFDIPIEYEINENKYSWSNEFGNTEIKIKVRTND